MRYPFDQSVLGTMFGKKGTMWACGYHSGLDLKSTNYGGDGKVHPILAGKVIKVTTTGSYGNCVYIQHNNGYISLYAHLKKILVSKGQEVTEKTVLGIEGTTGNSTGVHLHIEVHKGSCHYPATIDPLEFIKGGLEVEKKIKIQLNGKVKEVNAIQKEGYNYVKLQDLNDGIICISYDAKAKMPIIEGR